MEGNHISELNNVIEEILGDIERTRKLLSKSKTPQVRTINEQEVIRAVAKSWFERYKTKFPTTDQEWETMTQIDCDYNDLLDWSYKATSRVRYLELLRVIKSNLIRVRSEILSGSYRKAVSKNILNLERLVPNGEMRQIIYQRIGETEKCLLIAPLAATVMMGALLEALFLARINKLDDKSILFKLKSIPLEDDGRTPLNLSKWTLKYYIPVAHEMGWIRKAAKDVSSIMMEYRNLIHPEKQLRLGVTIEPQDANMFWVIFMQLSEQIVESAKL